MSDVSRSPGDSRESEREPGTGAESEDATEEFPEWDDEYLHGVSRRLLYNYDLEKDRSIRGERFELYGRMELTSRKHFLHPALSFAHHESTEHLFVTRRSRIDDGTLDRLVDLGHELAEEWIEPDEEHFSTDFTFVVVTESIPESLEKRVADFSDRTLLKFGYNGHYELNAIVVDPDAETLVASENADVATAFRLWQEIERAEPGVLDLIARRFQL
ncbi:hypothetical protein [Halovivax sp.]|uniref:hypothetical protein n=1 Tax=Halovivax sp. TaxID=1935978 RepID=UPI0025C63B91|nr:hypothetical protein [Halovivax sp.]